LKRFTSVEARIDATAHALLDRLLPARTPRKRHEMRLQKGGAVSRRGR
jgi:hypothetical protein